MTLEELLEELVDRPIAFHRLFVTVTGSVKSGLMLSQAYYWSRRTKNKDRWFYKTINEWSLETGLTPEGQATARKELRKTTFWFEERRGVPCRVFYRIDLPKLIEALRNLPTTQFPRTTETKEDCAAQFPRTTETSVSANRGNKLPSNTATITETTTEITETTLREVEESDRDAEYEARAQACITRNQADMSLHQYRMITECPSNLRARDRLICRPAPSPRLAEELKAAPEETKAPDGREPVLAFMERTFHKAIGRRKTKFPPKWPKSMQFPEEFEQQAERMGYNEYCEAWLEHLDTEKPHPFAFIKQLRSNGHA